MLENMQLRNDMTDAEIIKAIDTIVTNKKTSLDIYDTTPVYTVKKFAKKLGISEHTVRYYDKEHLFPFVTRDDSSNERLFSDADWAYGKMIVCLRKLRLSIHDCRVFILDTMEGDITAKERLHILTSLQKELVKEMALLQETYNDLQYKIRFYSHLETEVAKELDSESYTNKNRGTLSELKKFIEHQKTLE